MALLLVSVGAITRLASRPSVTMVFPKTDITGLFLILAVRMADIMENGQASGRRVGENKPFIYKKTGMIKYNK